MNGNRLIMLLEKQGSGFIHAICDSKEGLFAGTGNAHGSSMKCIPLGPSMLKVAKAVQIKLQCIFFKGLDELEPNEFNIRNC